MGKERTNEVLDKVLKDVDKLIEWAQADYDASVESHANYSQRLADARRVNQLKEARLLLAGSHKS